jgi:hypothetical protein
LFFARSSSGAGKNQDPSFCSGRQYLLGMTVEESPDGSNTNELAVSLTGGLKG